MPKKFNHYCYTFLLFVLLLVLSAWNAHAIERIIIDDSHMVGFRLVQDAAYGDIIVPKGGGDIYVLSVPVNESISWNEAVRRVGRNTQTSDDIWLVEDKYLGQAGATETI